MSIRFHPALLASALFLFSGCGAHPSDPLGKAAAQGDLTQLERLLASGASAEDRQGALVWAARYGQPKAVAAMIQSGADPNARSGVNDWPVLMHAIHTHQPASVSALLAGRADVNGRSPNGETPLMMAAGYGYSEIVRILLAHGADARATLPNGENALDFAVKGVMDIDRFTWGTCQSEAAKLLRAHAPGLLPRDEAKLKKCS